MAVIVVVNGLLPHHIGLDWFLITFSWRMVGIISMSTREIPPAPNGGHTNKVIKSSGNYLYLKFTSDSVINKKGFLIAYEGNSVTSLMLLLL